MTMAKATKVVARSFVVVAAFTALAFAREARAADVALTIAPVSPTRWTMRLENKGTLPVRLVADARLLTLDITPAPSPPVAGKRAAAVKTVRCSLPADMRPSSDGPRGVVLVPGKAFKESFDPRLYCFGATETSALATNATVVAHYGWIKPAPRVRTKTPAPLTPPFIVAPIAFQESDPKAAPVVLPTPQNEVVSAPMPLAASAVSPTLPTSPPIAPATGDLDLRLAASVTRRLDGSNADEIAATVTVANVGSRAVTLLLRPQTVGFEITAPNGALISCTPPGASPIREFFSTIAVRGQSSLSVLLGAVCPDHTFDLPGLYEVQPHLDLRRSSGSSLGLTTFDGEILGPPSLLRIRAAHGGVVPAPPLLE
ncbi:MAG: hypothetical protein JWM74_4786 [Myxococcaceae bacterium]|nr:hypothetical protein [Myxococcaceae bacterium]